MLKKKLNSITPFSRFFLPSRGPSIANCSFSQSSSPFSSSSCSGTAAEEERVSFSFNFSSSRVFQNPRINSGLFFQRFNPFCSGSSFAEQLQCWNCNSAPPTNSTAFLVCQTCRSVQPVNHSIDYFQILGLEKKYEIEGENLERKYKDWQKKLHPDLVHTKSQEEREYAAEQSARVIDAYRTLTNPLSRAKYILTLQGVEVDEEERITDPELLSEIMEIREAVEEAADTQALCQIQSQKSVSNAFATYYKKLSLSDASQLHALKVSLQMHGKLEHWSKSFADAFKSRKYNEAVTSIRRMTYYMRAIEEIVKKL